MAARQWILFLTKTSFGGVAHFGAGSSGWFFVWIEIVPGYGAAVVAASKRLGLPRLRKTSLIGY
jgi:hypothetical protein